MRWEGGPRRKDEAMTSRTLYLGGLVVFGMLSVVDLCLTWLVIHQSGGRIQEGNPIAGAWLMRFGWPGLVAFKVGAMTVVALAVVIISRRRPVVAAGVVLVSCLIVAMVV